MNNNVSENTLGIYCHIPFCKSKCSYCDFNSYTGKETLVDDYFEALENEAAMYADTDTPLISSVFIGGGTPSLVDAEMICHLLRHVKGRFRVAGNAEISIECNPGTLTPNKLRQYLDCGINRISIGVQSCSDRLLQTLGRIHTSRQATDAMEMAFDIGFINVNADLIFGIPGQTPIDWEDTLKTILQYPLKHLSCYSLKIEEGTPLHRQVASGAVTPSEDEIDREMYHTAISMLKDRGYKHYEISNFAVPGFECRHNLIYWHAEEYIGIGAGAHSYLNRYRYHNTESPEAYIDEVNNAVKVNRSIEANRDIKANGDINVMRHDTEFINRDEAISEFMILGLRLIDGIEDNEFYKRFGVSVFERYRKITDILDARQLISIENSRIRLTDLGMDLSNQVFMEYIQT